MVITVIDSIMIAFDKHQCTNHFHSNAETNYNNNSISHFKPL